MGTHRAAGLALLAIVCSLLTLVTPHAAQAGHRHGHRHALPKVSIADVLVAETDRAALATFTVTVKKPTGKKVRVSWATADGTATAPSDYTAASGKLVFKG